MWRVTGNSTCPSISAGSTFTAVKHLVTALTCGAEAKSRGVRNSREHLRLLQHRFCRALIGTCVSGTTFTTVAVGELDAVVGASGITGVRQTLVHVPFAALAYVTSGAHALVASDAVHALAVVEALGLVCNWVAGGVAVVQINLAVDA